MPGGSGEEHAQAARGYVEDLYAKLHAGKTYPVSPTTRGLVAQAATKLNSTGQFQQEAREAGQVVNNIMGEGVTLPGGRVVNSNFSGQQLNERMLTPLNQAAHDPKANAELSRRLLEARGVLRQRAMLDKLSPDELVTLNNLDIKNFDVNRLAEATKGAKGFREGASVSKLVDSYGKNKMVGNTTAEDFIKPLERVVGKTANQDMARTQLVNTARIFGGATAGGLAAAGGPATLAGVGGLYGVSALGQTPGGARFLFGQNEWQKKMAQWLRQAAPYGAGAGQTLTPEN